MRIATFNVENLFERPDVMNLNIWADGREAVGFDKEHRDPER